MGGKMAPCQRRAGDATTGTVAVCRRIYGTDVFAIAAAPGAVTGWQMTNNTDRTMETGCL